MTVDNVSIISRECDGMCAAQNVAMVRKVLVSKDSRVCKC
jgi:hypothetical protein